MTAGPLDHPRDPSRPTDPGAPAPSEPAGARAAIEPPRPLWRHLVRLARPAQWSKSAFVLVGPLYGLRDLATRGEPLDRPIIAAVLIAAAFALASSGCYVINDLADRVADRSHPRKKRRPIAAGHVSVSTARIFAAVLFVAAAALTATIGLPHALWAGLCLLLYVANVSLYSALLKHRVIADVVCLAMGFVLRVMGGCAAAGVEPSVWLLNCTFFLSMFLAFGKRLGERRTLAKAVEGAAPADLARAVQHRRVQAGYTDTLLQMAMVVTAVSTLLTYGSYVQDSGPRYVVGFNLLWLTMLPAFYALFRAMVKVEQGVYDDPTELAIKDRPFQIAGLAFALVTIGCAVLPKLLPS